jgi:hypothetical protein
MSFDRYFITSSYALFAMSFVMLAATNLLDGPTILLFGCVLAAGWMIDSGKLRWSITPKSANWLILGYLPFAVIEWQIAGVFPVTVIIHFILFTSSLKLLRKKTNRDWLWLYMVSFCQVLMTAGMMISTTFLLLLIFYLFAAISTFVSYEIRSSQQIFEANRIAHNAEAPPSAIEFWKDYKNSRRKLASPRWRSLSYFSAVVLVFVLLLAIPIFLAMPRLNRGFSRNGLLATETLSGFSDTVRLGVVAQVKLNPQIVMRVRVKFPNIGERPPLRWRGVTLAHYDGQLWSESGAGPMPIKKVTESFRVDDKFSPYGVTQQHFFVEPLNINTVFAAHRPILVTGLPELSRDSGDGLWTEPHSFHKIDYVVYSDTSLPTDAELLADNTRVYPLDTRQRYLQLPPDHDSRIDDLAADITRGATTQIEITRRIEQHLRTSYNYTLNLQRVEEGDPVADFLFNARSGHCEYFASAMVLMLRSRRVPARLVNGFQTGEYNNSADVYTVRQSDAHSWVEVYFPKSGWVAFDPTPPAGLSVYDDGLFAWLRHYGEAMEMFWLEHVVGFDTGKQLSMAITMQRWLSSYQRGASSRWFEWVADLGSKVESWQVNWRMADGKIFESKPSSDNLSRFTTHPLTLTLFGLAVLIGTALVWRKHSLSWQRRIKHDAQSSAVVFYQEMLRTLERAGHKREPHQTPSEFAAQLAIPGVSEITRLYQRTRFGHESLTDVDAAYIDGLLRELKKQSSGGRQSRISNL